MIFDVNLDAWFTRNARFVADMHKVLKTSLVTYESVLSRDSVCIVLILSDFNGLDVKCFGIQNAYLKSNPKERVWFLYGQYFGVHKGRLVVAIRDLYVLKGAVYKWGLSLRKLMRDPVFNPCIADGDVDMRVAIDTSELQ